MKALFHRFATKVAELAGSAYAFLAALALVVGWLASGPLFGFSDTWQLVINTGTTIITFLMVFLIQSTQNRDTQKMLAALEELVRKLPQTDSDVMERADKES